MKKAMLAPGESMNVYVSFKPKARGNRNAVIRISSNDKNENPFEIRLRGSGSPK